MTTSRAIFLAKCIVVALFASACARTHVTVPQATLHQPPVEGELLVGTARVDITPPPGVSSFGHAPDAHVMQGYWTRLYCRVFVLANGPDANNRVALVPCDLAAVSSLLYRAVIDKLQGEVPRTHVMLSATHTHAGPAHYFESYAYGGVASSHLPGYDPAMVEFLASRIANAIHAAAGSMVPATMRWQHATAWGLNHNRSLDAYQANPGPPLDFGAPAFPPGHEATAEQVAVDPRLDILELETREDRNGWRMPLGWVVLFAMHPTVLPAENRLLGGDTHGAASRMMESEIRRIGEQRARECAQAGPVPCPVAARDPLVGILNTNEGDMSPNWSLGTPDEALSVARRLASAAVSAYDADGRGWHSSVTMGAAYLERVLPGASVKGEVSGLCPHPELGNATGHGASDHRASLDYILATGPDSDPSSTRCQAPKLPLLGNFQNLLLGREKTRYPTDVSFSMLQLDKVWLTFVPAELTVHAGALVNDRVKATVGDDKAEARIVGLTNSYIQYVTTETEYRLQKYEGASTLYGPKSAAYFANQAQILAQHMRGVALSPDVDSILPLDFETAPERSRLATPENSGTRRATRAANGLCRVVASSPSRYCFWWTDDAPGVVPMTTAGNLPWVELVDGASGAVIRPHAPFPALNAAREAIPDPGAIIDDRGVDFKTAARRRQGDGYLWSTLFTPGPAELSGVGGAQKIRVRSAGGNAIESAPFSADRAPPECSVEQLAQCLVDR